MNERTKTPEPLVNAVIVNRRKMLLRLDQKVGGQERVLGTHPSRTLLHRRIGGVLIIRWFSSGTW